MTRLGLVTKVRNYKRRTGSYTDGCTKTGEEEAGSYHSSKTSLRTTHTTQGYTGWGESPAMLT